MVELVERVPSIVAIKDWAGDPQLHERHIRALPVDVLTTHSAWLLSSLVAGAQGLLSGAGSVIARRQVDLFRAVRDDDLAAARAAWDRIQPLTDVFYAQPWGDMHNRMKCALHALGEIACPAVRPPLVPLPEDERAAIAAAVYAAAL